jgi:hypothetical protein
MRTLLKRDWRPEFARQVPASFLSGCLLPALNSPVHHAAGGGGGGDAAFDAGAAAAEFAGAWATAAAPGDVRALVSDLLCALASPAAPRELTRPGVLSYISCALAAAHGAGAGLLDWPAAAAAAAAAAEGDEPRGSSIRSSGGGGEGGSGSGGADECSSSHRWASEQLHKLASFLAAGGWRHGAAARADCCRAALRLAARLAPRGGAGDGRFAASLRVLTALPAWCEAPEGGELHFEARAWLLGEDASQQAQQEAQQEAQNDGRLQAAGAESAAAVEAEAGRLWDVYFEAGGDGAAAGSGTGSGGGGAQRRPSGASEYVRWTDASEAWSRRAARCWIL